MSLLQARGSDAFGITQLHVLKEGENIFNTNEIFSEFFISYQHYNLTVTFSEAIKIKTKVGTSVKALSF